MQRPVIYLYTDGAASGNPGPGGYGVVLKCAGLTREISGGFRTTTNNRMELLAVIVGLEAIKWANAEVEVWSDSSYVVKAVTEGWLLNWERKGFVKVKNTDLWMRFLNVYRRHRVTFHWLKGHAGHPEMPWPSMPEQEPCRGVRSFLRTRFTRVKMRAGSCSDNAHLLKIRGFSLYLKDL